MTAETLFSVRLTPRGGADRIEGVRDGVLHVRVAAPPVEGEANLALLRLLARELGVPSGALTIVGGERGRTKRIVVAGVAHDLVAARWPGLTI